MALLGQPIDERTAALALPLPHIGNYQEDDVPRLRAALELIDTALQLLIRPCEVLSRVANVTILEVANNALRVLLQHRHVIIGSLA